jgi:hypothetical protein
VLLFLRPVVVVVVVSDSDTLVLQDSMAATAADVHAQVGEVYRVLEQQRKSNKSDASTVKRTASTADYPSEVQELITSTADAFGAVMRNDVAKVPLFKDCPDQFLDDVSKSLLPVVYFPGEPLVCCYILQYSSSNLSLSLYRSLCWVAWG